MFDQLAYSVAEDAGTVTLNLELGAAQDPTQAEVWVTLDTANGPLALCKLNISNYIQNNDYACYSLQWEQTSQHQHLMSCSSQ